MNKSILFASIITTAIITGIIASGELAEAEKPELLAVAVCPAENVQHWETLAWSSADVVFEHPTLPSVEGGIMKAQADPNTVYNYNELAASALNTMGYLNSGSGFAFDQAEPQIICAES